MFGLFGDRVPVSSTKGTHGHTLGAAGGLEAAVALICLQDGLIPGGLFVDRIDPALHCRYQTRNSHQPLQRVMSNSFGFGGANCSLVFARGRP